MAAHGGPRVETSGLTMVIDPSNVKTNPKIVYNNNILNYSTWTVSSGAIGMFGINGTAAENTRVYDTDPFNQSSIVWQSPTNDVTSDADGGWNTDNIVIDPTKLYRFSVWIRRKVLGNGSYYLGTRGLNSSGTNIGVLNRSNGAVNTNPYFGSAAWTLNVNQWYLFVGHVWPIGSGTGAVHPDTGIYTTAGVKVGTPTDFVWQTGVTQTVHRTYLYYSTDTTTVQQWSHPRLDLCNGNQVPVSGVISNQMNTMISLTRQNNATVKNQVQVTVDKTLSFNNNTHYLALPNSLGYTTSVSVFAWVKIAGAPKGGYHIICGGAEFELSIPTAGSLRTGVTTSSGRYVINQGSGLADGNWHYVGMVVSGTTKTAYIDGSSVGTQTIAGTLVSSFANRAIGQFGSDTTYALNGEMSSYRVFNSALTAAQVRQNFQALRGRFGI